MCGHNISNYDISKGTNWNTKVYNNIEVLSIWLCPCGTFSAVVAGLLAGVIVNRVYTYFKKGWPGAMVNTMTERKCGPSKNSDIIKLLRYET